MVEVLRMSVTPIRKSLPASFILVTIVLSLVVSPVAAAHFREFDLAEQQNLITAPHHAGGGPDCELTCRDRYSIVGCYHECRDKYPSWERDWTQALALVICDDWCDRNVRAAYDNCLKTC
jgi:hypothetical protein